MIRKILNKNRRIKTFNIDPDEIFLDSSNLPGFDTHQFEGRFEKPISKLSFLSLAIVFILLVIVFIAQAWNVQINQGEQFRNISENNKLRKTLIFSDRGMIFDANGHPLSWNETRDDVFNTRRYITTPGFAKLLGYVSYPKRDSSGFFYDESIVGLDGIEKSYDRLLSGVNGERMIEINAVNNIVSENSITKPVNGENVYLTIDHDVQKKLFDSIKNIVNERGFTGGGGVIMNVQNGDMLALVSYPEYDSNILTDATNKEKINEFLNDKRNPFLNKIADGNYTPGSIVKPFIAAAALQENVIHQEDKIISRGTLVIPNPYNPANPSVFTDWRAHGAVNVREALAWSSNIYFYIVGGGYDDIEGLGITKINQYLEKFGFGRKIESEIWSGGSGVVPSPEWKRQIFDDDWRLGDTYFTAIGQYGFQVVPLQVVRATAAIANKGRLIEPNIILNKDDIKFEEIEGIDDWVYEVVKEGMREAVEYGSARGLNYNDFTIAAKTGTAELGATKQKVNSWLVGFWPYEDPKYAFAIFLEEGDRANLIGGVAVARNFFDWLKVNKPEYLK